MAAPAAAPSPTAALPSLERVRPSHGWPAGGVCSKTCIACAALGAAPPQVIRQSRIVSVLYVVHG